MKIDKRLDAMANYLFEVLPVGKNMYANEAMHNLSAIRKHVKERDAVIMSMAKEIMQLMEKYEPEELTNIYCAIELHKLRAKAAIEKVEADK